MIRLARNKARRLSGGSSNHRTQSPHGDYKCPPSGVKLKGAIAAPAQRAEVAPIQREDVPRTGVLSQDDQGRTA